MSFMCLILEAEIDLQSYVLTVESVPWCLNGVLNQLFGL